MVCFAQCDRHHIISRAKCSPAKEVPQPSAAAAEARSQSAGSCAAPLIVGRVTLENAIMAQPKRRLDVRIKRAYLPASACDGTRILIDRIWGTPQEADFLAR